MALAIVTDSIQLAEYGIKAFRLLRTLRNGSSDPAELVDTTTDLQNTCDRVHSALSSDKLAHELPEQERDIIQQARRCSEAAKQLLQEFRRLEPCNVRGRWSQAFLVTARKFYRSDHIKQLTTQLESHRDALLLALVARRSLAEKSTRKNLKDSLFFPQLKARMEEISAAHRRTFEWIFQNSATLVKPKFSSFTRWLEKGEGTFWISGKVSPKRQQFLNTRGNFGKARIGKIDIDALHRPA
ncbi:MAG: hypothetical protein Q9159_004441 [Coniocarpon cinnabarinum]